MESRIWPALIAILFGSLLLVVVLVPIIAANYRRFGRLSPLRLLLLGAFSIYAAALVTYTMLPLPEPGSFACAAPRFMPGASLRDIFDYDVSSVRAVLANPGVLQIALNVLLFVPLGFFTRLLWGRGVGSTIVIGFGISVCIETSQLTGLWGLYDCAYRLFDADDIIVNTFGALVGAALAALLGMRAVTPRGQLRARPVTLGRRLLGMVCDFFVAGAIGAVAEVSANIVRYAISGGEAAPAEVSSFATLGWGVAVATVFVVTLATGRTPGDAIVNLRFTGATLPTWLGRLLRCLFGIGGYLLLGAPPLVAWLPGAAPGLFALALVVSVTVMRDRSGLAGVLSGQRVSDAFAPLAR